MPVFVAEIILVGPIPVLISKKPDRECFFAEGLNAVEGITLGNKGVLGVDGQKYLRYWEAWHRFIYASTMI